MSTISLLDWTLPTPAENLALDEALLLRAERAFSEGEGVDGAEVLRFWESPVHFAVLGVSRRLQADVDVDACARDGIVILRRASGGGTVLQGPGCLNFALVLSLKRRPELRDVTRSYSLILGRLAAGLALEGLTHQGTSDLALGDTKVSGNAQKRTRHALLHHGTILHAFDIGRMAACLREPQEVPRYRAGRPHGEFVENLRLTAEDVKLRIAREWDAEPPAEPIEIPDLSELLREKYLNREWTERF